jgi:4-amino-4-deoxy-L-arabinose transferase-like glycosyltransferase
MMKALHISAWLTLAAIVFVTVSPIDLRPGDILPVNVDRAAASAALAALFTLAYPRRWLSVGLIMIAGAAAIELLQVFSPTRHARIDDALVKSFGALVGVFAAVTLNAALDRIRVRYRQAKSSVTTASLAEIVAAFGNDREMQLQSRLIKSIYFSPETGTLRVCFRNGEERAFDHVPPEEVMEMVQSPSPGQHYLEKVRKNYPRRAA